jgi:hypothetical protein
LVRRAGPHVQGALETGLASSVRHQRQRAELLGKLHAQSLGNAKTARFLEQEIAALERHRTLLGRLR